MEVQNQDRRAAAAPGERPAESPRTFARQIDCAPRPHPPAVAVPKGHGYGRAPSQGG